MLSRIKKQLSRRKGDLWLVSAKWTAPVLSMVGGLVAARNLRPEELGVVHAVMLVPAYAGILHLGVFNGLNRNLPLFRAKNMHEKVQAFVNASFTFSIFLAGFGALVALIAAISFHFRSDNPDFAYVSLFLILAMIFGPLKLHQDVVFRGTRQFERLGKNLHISNTWAFLCSISTSFIGLTGLALKVGTMQMLSWLLLLKNPPIKSNFGGTVRDTWQLSAVGMPIMISGLIFMWLTAADRTVIALLLTAEDLGHYALAGIAAAALTPFSASINLLLYPRVAHAYGKNGSSRCLRRYIWIGLALNLVVLLPVAVIGWVAIPHLVEAYLPAYIPGIDAARITLVGGIFSASSGPSVIIPILRKNFRSQLAGMLAIGVVWCGGIYAITEGFGITGVAWARVAGMAIYGLFVIGYVFRLTYQDIRCEDE